MQLSKLVVLAVAIAHVTALYSDNGPVELLTQSNFDSKVVKGDGVWFVEFFAPWCGHCKNLVPEWEKAAKALKGVVHVAAVDATAHQGLGNRFEVQGYPTILVFGANKNKPEPYEGGRTSNDIVKAAMKAAQSLVDGRVSGKSSSGGSKKSDSGSKKGGSGSHGSGSNVVELTSANFESEVINSGDAWMVEFFAPWCGHCKNLAPEWEKVANELKGTIKVGAVDATVHGDLGSRYGVKGYPTLKFFPPTDKSNPIAIESARTSSALVQWGLDKLEEFGGAAPPEVNEITSDAAWKECLSKKLCAVGVLPHIIDGGAKERNAYIAKLQEAGKGLRGKPVQIMWAEGGAQPELENALGLSFGYPALAVVSESKQRYYTHRLAFTADSIVKAVNGLATGKRDVITQKLAKSPEIKAVTPWDGGDYKAAEDL